jgi:hypothetical protein
VVAQPIGGLTRKQPDHGRVRRDRTDHKPVAPPRPARVLEPHERRRLCRGVEDARCGRSASGCPGSGSLLLLGERSHPGGCFLFERLGPVNPLSSSVEERSFLFRRSSGAPSRIEAVPASQFACGPSGGQKAERACRDKMGVGVARLEGLFAAEHVPAGDENLAGDGRLGRVGLAGPRLDVRVRRCRGFVSRQAPWAASTAAKRSVREPAFDSSPERERSPDCLTRGARPE